LITPLDYFYYASVSSATPYVYAPRYAIFAADFRYDMLMFRFLFFSPFTLLRCFCARC